jgi:hypothetical protein
MGFQIQADALNVRDAKNQIKHARKAVREFIKLHAKINKKVNVASFDKKPRFKKYISAFSEVEKYLDTYMGTLEEAEGSNRVRNGALNLLVTLLFEGEPVTPIEEGRVKRYADQGFEYKLLFVEQASVRERIPQAIRKYLPRNIVFKLDDAGNISQVRDRVGNQGRDLLHKHDLLANMISNYNDLVDEVLTDMKSPHEDLRLSAILTAIMMETGIRPGSQKIGKTVRKDSGGNVVEEISTFGASSLRPSHITEFREDFVQIKFVGKSGVDNIAELSNTEIIEALTPYIEKASEEVGLGSGDPESQLPIFRGLSGFQYDYNYLRRYVKSKVGSCGLEPRDFRMLKATRKFYDHFEEEQEDLHTAIKALVQRGTADLKKLVADEVSEFFNDALERASQGLSHMERQNTIDYYVSPMIVLNFISQGYVERNIEKAILQGFDTISFDVDKFIEVANTIGTPSYPLGRTAGENLLSLMSQLDDSLGERTSGENLLELMDMMDSSLGSIN